MSHTKASQGHNTTQPIHGDTGDGILRGGGETTGEGSVAARARKHVHQTIAEEHTRFKRRKTG